MTENASFIERTSLEGWIASRIGLDQELVARDRLDQYQLTKLQETLRWAYACSPFYRDHLRGLAEEEITCLAELSRLPFTTADHIRHQGLRFLCVSQDDISRVVTLDSSGTTGTAKRLFFTPQDQELTIQMFQYGMADITEPGDRVLILLPGERPGSVGDLLAAALRRLDVTPIPHGAIQQLSAAIEVIVREDVNVLVGIPTQVLALARYAHTVMGLPLRLKNVLLSTDHVPVTIVRELEELWQCKVFEHYGMTEMGLGGGTACRAHAGYHLHEADCYYEIVHPLTGESVPDGEIGEVVITTLNRRGMPLVRYRTGDLSRFLPELCPCGSRIRRLERLSGRKSSAVQIDDNRWVTLAEIDEALFAVKAIVNFQATIIRSQPVTTMQLDIITVGEPHSSLERSCLEAMDTIASVGSARREGQLMIAVTMCSCEGALQPTTAKRMIREVGEDHKIWRR